LSAIEKALQKYHGIQRAWVRREVEELKSVLWEDEVVEDAVIGIYHKGVGLLVATNKRLVFIEKGLLAGITVEDFALDKITSMQYRFGWRFGTLIIFASGNKAEIRKVPKPGLRAFADFVRARISGRMEHSSYSAPSMATDYTEIEKLAELHGRGILTDEEYTAKKKQILGLS
jgi:hypothetical protein